MDLRSFGRPKGPDEYFRPYPQDIRFKIKDQMSTETRKTLSRTPENGRKNETCCGYESVSSSDFIVYCFSYLNLPSKRVRPLTGLSVILFVRSFFPKV